MTDLARLRAAIRGECEPPRWWIGEPLPTDPAYMTPGMRELRAEALGEWPDDEPQEPREWLVYDLRQLYGPPELVVQVSSGKAERRCAKRHGGDEFLSFRARVRHNKRGRDYKRR